MNDTEWSDWVDDIRTFIAAHGRLPTLDIAELRIPADRQLDCWHADADELVDLCRIADASAAGEARVATVLFCWYLVLDEPWALPPHELDRWNDSCQTMLRDAVESMPIDAIANADDIKWEIIHAALAGLWTRVLSLVRSWIDVAPEDEALAWCCAARVGFLRLRRFRPHAFNQEFWLRYDPEVPDRGAAYVVTEIVNAVDHVDCVAGQWSWPLSLTESEVGTLVDTAAATAKSARQLQSLENQVLAAWCQAVLGVHGSKPLTIWQAAKDFMAVARDETVAPDCKVATARFATTLFRQCARLDDAREAVLLWLHFDALSAEAWRIRAGLENRMGLPCAQSYEEFVRLDSEPREDWQRTALLHLARKDEDEITRKRHIEVALLSYEGRPFASATIGFHWAAYAGLDSQAREKWCTAVIAANDPGFRRTSGDDWSDVAAAFFGKAVELELRHRIFGPFIQSTQLDLRHLTDDERRVVEKLRKNALTLGEAIEVLVSAVGATKSLGKMLAAFLRAAHQPLWKYIQSTAVHTSLRALNVRRREAVHDHMDSDHLHSVHRIASAFLTVVVEADPRLDVASTIAKH